jgi:hypothetical protein
MGKAVSYALAQWQFLEASRFTSSLKEPGIEIDNNLVENAIRPTAHRELPESGRRALHVSARRIDEAAVHEELPNQRHRFKSLGGS